MQGNIQAIMQVIMKVIMQVMMQAIMLVIVQVNMLTITKVIMQLIKHASFIQYQASHITLGALLNGGKIPPAMGHIFFILRYHM